MHVFQVGVGSGGIVVLDLVARDTRVTKVTVVDPDFYRAHNVVRHLYPASYVGQRKADLAVRWLADRRPDLTVEALPVDVTAADYQVAMERTAAACDVGICAVDNEPAKHHFDALMRKFKKPWSLGEVLSGGIGGWIHRFVSDGPCYACVSNYLHREAPADSLKTPAPDYSAPGGQIQEATIPADRASISTIASLHAVVTLSLLTSPNEHPGYSSALLTLRRVPDVFEQPLKMHRFAIPRLDGCLVCSAGPGPGGEDLDVALDQALARLGDE